MDNLPGEVRDLRERMDALFPQYVASLQRLADIPVESDRRFWVSRVDSLIEVVRGNYQKYEVARSKADLLSKFMTMATDLALMAARKEPIPFPATLQICISISPEGRIEPVVDDPASRAEGVIFLTFPQLEAIARKLKEGILNGRVVPIGEEEIPKLIRGLVLEGEK